MTYDGSCHCGAIRFRIDAPIVELTTCDCSLCVMRNALMTKVPDHALTVLEGEAELSLYEWNTRRAKHYFCRHCGIHPFIRPRLDPTRWAFNVRCIDGIDLRSLKVVPFDGQNWEATARAYHDRHKKNPDRA